MNNFDAFKLWCWRRLFRVPWIERRSNQSILKETNPQYSLEGLMLKLHYFGHMSKEPIHKKRPRCWERLKAGGEGDDSGRDGWMASPMWWTWVWVPEVGNRQWSLAFCSPRGRKDSDTTEWLKWTDAFEIVPLCSSSSLHLRQTFSTVSFVSSWYFLQIF